MRQYQRLSMNSTLSSLLQVRLDGAVVTHFLPLEAALDAAVGGSVTVEVERGGAPVTARLVVRDLHTVTPAALLQVCGSVLHALSYQQARIFPVLNLIVSDDVLHALHSSTCCADRLTTHHCLQAATPEHTSMAHAWHLLHLVLTFTRVDCKCFLLCDWCSVSWLSLWVDNTRVLVTSTNSCVQARNGQLATGQVYVADTGYWLVRAGVPKHAIVTALGGRPTPDLATFASVLATLRPGTKAPIQYATFEQRQRTCSGLVHIDWTW